MCACVSTYVCVLVCLCASVGDDVCMIPSLCAQHTSPGYQQLHRKDAVSLNKAVEDLNLPAKVCVRVCVHICVCA